MKKYYLHFFLFPILMIMLSGCIQTLFIGALSSAVEFAKDRTPTETMQDAKIATAIKASFIQKGFSNLYMKIKTEIMRGRVLLTGEVEKQADIIQAIDLIWQQECVNEVINELTINKDSKNFDLKQYTQDSFITSQVKSKIFFQKNVKFVNYTVVTFKNTVYLFGIAASQQELEKIAKLTANLNNVKKVVSHVVIDATKNDDCVHDVTIYKKTNSKLKKESRGDLSPLIIRDTD